MALTRWPANRMPLDAEQRQLALDAVKREFAPAIANLKVDLGLDALFEEIYVPLACWIVERHTKGTPLVVGINGAQGAGKATLFNIMEVILAEGFGLKVVGFSIDDLYLTRAEREQLAADVHPLLTTRGVPGTHDVNLGLRLLNQLRNAGPDEHIRIPIFDKSTDERCPVDMWHEWNGGADIIFVDGWCIGAIPEPTEALEEPVNELEREEDQEGVWRQYVNKRLAGDYQTLFDELDLLVMLKVPSMQSVYDWRAAQEQKLQERAAVLYDDRPPSDPLRIMDETQIFRFIAHYERLTRWMLESLPERADVTFELNENHKIAEIRFKA